MRTLCIETQRVRHCVRSVVHRPCSPRADPFPPPPPQPPERRCSAGSQAVRGCLTSRDRPSRDYRHWRSPRDPRALICHPANHPGRGIINHQRTTTPEQGRWLARVLQGHYNYYAVPDKSEALHAFRRRVIRLWLQALRRRSQNDRLTWTRSLTSKPWLSEPRILHPWPDRRFDARTQGRSLVG
jgi:hypothetical protein